MWTMKDAKKSKQCRLETEKVHQWKCGVKAKVPTRSELRTVDTACRQWGRRNKVPMSTGHWYCGE